MKENFHFSQGGKEKRLLFSLGFAGKKKGENALFSEGRKKYPPKGG
jgi:hypothetical protein